MTQRKAWKVAWITGGSTGIGREVALLLAQKGVTVAISARSSDKLDEVALRHASIHPYPLDVTNREEVAAAARRIAAEHGPIDLALLNAGVFQPMNPERFSAKMIEDALAVNFTGAVNALEPLVPEMLSRGSGHVALMASVAGYRGLPRGAAYAPSKAAVISLAECLHQDISGRGVTVSVINPGYVDTPMTKKNTFPMPFMIGPEDAARRIVAGLERGQYEIAFPWPIVLLTKFGERVPNSLYFLIMRWFGGLAAPGDRGT